jgi:cytochrome b6-f complex iron-sulfur subunit
MITTTRREFLKQAGTLSASVCCLGTMNLLSSCSTTKGIAATNETADTATIPASSLAEKNFIIVQTKKFEEPLYISKQADGSYSALLMHCTHKGCTLNVAADEFKCPCHGSEFSFAGAVLKGPAKEPLQSFRVIAENQNVVVHFN